MEGRKDGGKTWRASVFWARECLKFPHMTEIRSPETCSRPSPSSSQTHVCAADDQQEKRKRSHMAFGSPSECDPRERWRRRRRPPGRQRDPTLGSFMAFASTDEERRRREKTPFRITTIKFNLGPIRPEHIYPKALWRPDTCFC